jgi:hypothetical protein
VDDFEDTRPPRRAAEHLKVNPLHRRIYLNRVVGVSTDEIEMSMRIAEDVRRKREETFRNMKNEKFDIFFQSFQRKTGRIWGNTVHPMKIATNSLIRPLMKRGSSLEKERNSPPSAARRDSESVSSLKAWKKKESEDSSKSATRRRRSTLHGYPIDSCQEEAPMKLDSHSFH